MMSHIFVGRLCRGIARVWEIISRTGDMLCNDTVHVLNSTETLKKKGIYSISTKAFRKFRFLICLVFLIHLFLQVMQPNPDPKR